MHINSLIDLSVQEDEQENVGVGLSESTMDLNVEALEVTGNEHILKKLKR